MAYLTEAEVAAMARVTTRTVANEVNRGHLRRVKFGRSVRFADTDVREWLSSSRNQTPANA